MFLILKCLFAEIKLKGMSDEYITVSKNEISMEVKKSKFISSCYFVSDEEEAKEIILGIKNSFRDATHHVYSYVLVDSKSKSCDDNEPSGTAGIQILKVIKNFNLKNTLVVVVRYFGGIKLGTGGLSRAYFDSAKKLIENTKLITKKMCYKVKLRIGYSDYNKILCVNKFKIINTNFDSEVTVTFAVEHSKLEFFKKEIEEILAEKVSIQLISSEYFDF